MSDDKPDTPTGPPAGSWRARLRDHEAETAVMEWDGEEWEIPAKLPNTYFEASNRGDARGVVEAILGIEGVAKLRIPRDIDAETMGELAISVSEAAGEVWEIPNLSRSARRSRSTRKH